MALPVSVNVVLIIGNADVFCPDGKRGLMHKGNTSDGMPFRKDGFLRAGTRIPQIAVCGTPIA